MRSFSQFHLVFCRKIERLCFEYKTDDSHHMTVRTLLPIAFALASGLLFSEENRPAPILGTYASPQTFWEAGHRLDEQGINAVFVRSQNLDEATAKRARSEGAKVFAEFATLNGNYGNYVKEHPEAHPIDETGKPAPAATWFMGACPTHEGFKKFRLDALRELVSNFELDGVFLDYTHWHAQFEDPYPVLLKTCFNDSCLHAFEKFAEVKIEGKSTAERAQWIFANKPKEWEDWRVSVIIDWVKECCAIIKEIQPKALVGIYHTAWKDEDLSGVRRRALGLDFDLLAEHVEVFSPMIYHGRSGKSPEYVKEFVDYLGQRPWLKTASGQYPQMWPIVQASDGPGPTTPGDLETVLRHGLSGKSNGVMMFTTDSLIQNPAKLDVVRKVYQEFSVKK